MTEYEKCWLSYNHADKTPEYIEKLSGIFCMTSGRCIDNAVKEINIAMSEMFGIQLTRKDIPADISAGICLKLFDNTDAEYTDKFIPDDEGYAIYYKEETNLIVVSSGSERGILYGVFRLMRTFQINAENKDIRIFENPYAPVRMINHWDNMKGDIERGYSGNSFFYEDDEIIVNDRTVAYARLMSSVGINAITINNVNVHSVETKLITDTFLSKVKEINDIFTSYGIKLYLSINFAAPVELGDIDTCDPHEPSVIKWWEDTTKHLYDVIPDFGGYLVKADSEGRPGPHTYGRSHTEGANMLARAVGKYGGIVIWRCFVYNCRQNWRDRKTDRARACYDNFYDLDGQFDDNVVLQIKNGPVDFQVREPVSPLFGALKETNVFVELQIAQEYTGQQIDVCYLVPMWKEILDFNTYATDTATVKRIVSGREYGNRLCGIAGVTNTGNDANWTGHDFAAANLFGFARLCWDPELTAEQIGMEWAYLTFGNDEEVCSKVYDIIKDSWLTYEKYTSPLGIGWMLNPSDHYGPNVNGYEYDVWGTYHRSDRNGLGQDRTVANGTGFTAQYNEPLKSMYENPQTTPDELRLFFHYTKYDYVLDSGKTLIQHIYDTHFEGVEEVKHMIAIWNSLAEKVDKKIFDRVSERFERQLNNAIEWRDRINTYFYRMSGIDDESGRTIY